MGRATRFDIVLASASPRRRQLLEEAGVKFRVHPADADESLDAELAAHPVDAVAQLAQRKAKAAVDQLAASEAERPLAVIGSDTMVVYQGEIFGKPRDRADAERMLHALSGHVHEVHTAVSVWKVFADDADTPEECRTFVDTTRVHFKELSDEQIGAYIDSGDPFDKAGAYGIQSGAAPFVDHIEGSLDTVIGFPVCRIRDEFPELF